MSRIMPQALAEGWLDLFIKVIDSGHPLNHEYFSPHYNKWLLLVGAKLGDGIAVTVNDISKRKNAQKELMDAEKLAVTGRVSRTIAHEVRNPLTNIDLSLQQLKEELKADGEAAAPFLDIISRNSTRINQLITELLNSSKPTQIEVKECNVNEVLDDTLALLGIHVGGEQVEVVEHAVPLEQVG